MNKKISLSIVMLFLLFPVILANGKTASGEQNVYLVDAMKWIDTLDNWQPIGRTEIKFRWHGWLRLL